MSLHAIAAAAYADAAQALSIAAAKIRGVPEDKRDGFVTALADRVDELRGTIVGRLQRAEKPPQTAPTAAPPAKPKVLTQGEFFELAALRLPTWSKVSADVRLRTYATYLACGMSADAFLALTPEGRAEQLGKHRAVADGLFAKLSGTPAPVLAPAAAQATDPTTIPTRRQAGKRADKAPAPRKPKAKPAPKAERPRCQGHKPDGSPCKSRITLPNGYCRAHQPKPAAAAAQTAAPTTAPTVPAAGGVFISDGKGGFRPADKGDIAALWAALEQLTAAGQ